MLAANHVRFVLPWPALVAIYIYREMITADGCVVGGDSRGAWRVAAHAVKDTV